MYDPKVRLRTLAALVDFCQGESTAHTWCSRRGVRASLVNGRLRCVFQVIKEASWRPQSTRTERRATRR